MEAGGPKAEVKAGQLLQGSGGTPCFPNAAAKPCRATPYVSRAPTHPGLAWPAFPHNVLARPRRAQSRAFSMFDIHAQSSERIILG